MSYDERNVFARILRKEIPTKLVYEDELCIAIRDIAPQAPTHVLVIPRESLTSLDDAGPDDRALLGHLLLAASKVARQEGVAADGYRVVINTGRHGGQSVPHLHLHVLGGREHAWPAG
jgi:histidine triad (HIT) family protein